MHSPAHDFTETGLNGAGPHLTTSSTHDPVILLNAVGTLVGSQSPAELAKAAAKLAEKLFEAEQAVVVLQGPEGVVVGCHPSPGGSLERWARDLLSEDPLRGPTSTGQQLAVGIDAPQAGLRGVIALSLRSAIDDELRGRLVELGQLVSTCWECTCSNRGWPGKIPRSFSARIAPWIGWRRW